MQLNCKEVSNYRAVKMYKTHKMNIQSFPESKSFLSTRQQTWCLLEGFWLLSHPVALSHWIKHTTDGAHEYTHLRIVPKLSTVILHTVRKKTAESQRGLH